MKEILKNINHNGVEITLVDFSDINDTVVAVEAVKYCIMALGGKPRKSLRLLYNLRNTIFNKTTLAEMDILTETIGASLIRSAVIGAEGMIQIIVQSSARKTTREVKMFDLESDALDWLVDGQST